MKFFFITIMVLVLGILKDRRITPLIIPSKQGKQASKRRSHSSIVVRGGKRNVDETVGMIGAECFF